MSAVLESERGERVLSVDADHAVGEAGHGQHSAAGRGAAAARAPHAHRERLAAARARTDRVAADTLEQSLV